MLGAGCRTGCQDVQWDIEVSVLSLDGHSRTSSVQRNPQFWSQELVRRWVEVLFRSKSASCQLWCRGWTEFSDNFEWFSHFDTNPWSVWFHFYNIFKHILMTSHPLPNLFVLKSLNHASWRKIYLACFEHFSQSCEEGEQYFAFFLADMMMTIQNQTVGLNIKLLWAGYCDSLSANIRNLLLLWRAAVTMTEDNVGLSARM